MGWDTAPGIDNGENPDTALILPPEFGEPDRERHDDQQ
jgi:hypothetical protein